MPRHGTSHSVQVARNKLHSRRRAPDVCVTRARAQEQIHARPGAKNGLRASVRARNGFHFRYLCHLPRSGLAVHRHQYHIVPLMKSDAGARARTIPLVLLSSTTSEAIRNKQIVDAAAAFAAAFLVLFSRAAAYCSAVRCLCGHLSPPLHLLMAQEHTN